MRGSGDSHSRDVRPLPLVLLYLVLILGNKNHLTHLLLVICTGPNLPNQLSKARHWGCQHAPPSGFSCDDGDVPNLLFLPPSPSMQTLSPQICCWFALGSRLQPVELRRAPRAESCSYFPGKGLSHGSGSWARAG